MNFTAIADLQDQLDRAGISADLPADAYISIAIQEALSAAREGNFGVGCLLVRDGEILARGHNQVFSPYFRSDLHAEMVALDQLEKRSIPIDGLNHLTLYSSLEPCPMCTVRIINSGINYAFWGAPDEQGGMGRRIEALPVQFRDLARHRVFQQADCSAALQRLAWQVFELTVEDGDRRLQARADTLS